MGAINSDILMNRDPLELLCQVLIAGFLVVPMIAAAFVVAPIMGVVMVITMLVLGLRR